MSVITLKPERREIPLGLLDPPRKPSRVSIDEDYLRELSRDIQAKGLINDLTVARNGERYEVVAGDCRSRACAMAGLVAVWCRVYPTYETALIGVQYSENRFRKELTAGEEAILFSDLLDAECGGDVDQLCELLGEKRSYVEGRLNLFSGDEQVFRALLEVRITIGVAQALNKCSDERMCRYFLDAALRGGATVAVVNGWVDEWKRSALPPSSAPAPTPTASGPIPQTNYFTCAVCGGTDNVHLMQPINVHTHCHMAILTPMLDAYKGDGK